MGLGFIFQPAVVMVGFWFEQKRAFAMGIASSGAGVGMLVMSSLSGYLLEVLDWKNALIMLCCVTLQCVFCGALLRPVQVKKCNVDISTPTKPVSVQGSRLTQGKKRSPKSPDFHFSKNSFLEEVIPIRNGHHIRTQSSCSYEKSDSTSKGTYSPTNAMYFSHQELSNQKVEHTHSYTSSNPLLKKDIFFSGSIRNIPNKELESAQAMTLSSIDKSSTQKGKCWCCHQDYFTPMKEMLSLHILADPSFIIIALANAFMQAGFVICVYFLTDYGIYLDISPEIAAYAVSVFGRWF